MQVHK